MSPDGLIQRLLLQRIERGCAGSAGLSRDQRNGCRGTRSYRSKSGPVAARVLCVSSRTGRTLAAVRLLSPSPRLDDLHDPLVMLGMPRAIERLRSAIAAREKILIYGDYDVDGTTSVVVLKKAIELAGGAALFHVPDRFTEGYGMRAEVVERASAEGVSLIVSVDTGIRAGDVVRRAAALGIDVVDVTDHHLPEAELAAGARRPESQSASHFQFLSGEEFVRSGSRLQADAGSAPDIGLAEGKAAPRAPPRS